MKRTLVNAICVGIVAVGGTRLAAQEPEVELRSYEYQTCMQICIESGGEFFDCHAQCKYPTEV